MFGSSSFVVKLVFIWSVICVVLVESVRQKKDVHHMIILGNGDKSRPVRSHRHKSYHSRGRDRHKRRPSTRSKHHNYPAYSSEESESFENFSEERSPRPKQSKPKRHHNRHKYSNHHFNSDNHPFYEDNQIQGNPYIPSATFPEVKWQPVSSQELFGNFPQSTSFQNNYHVFPGGYQSGALHYPQSVPLEITTQYSAPSNSFVGYDSTLYPPLNAQTFSSKDAYKPFDYSILEQKPDDAKKSTNKKTAPTSEVEVKTVTPFSIVVEGTTDAGKKEEKKVGGGWGTRNKSKRGRGGSKFEFGQREAGSTY